MEELPYFPLYIYIYMKGVYKGQFRSKNFLADFVQNSKNGRIHKSDYVVVNSVQGFSWLNILGT
jgi:hypothetical protein